MIDPNLDLVFVEYGCPLGIEELYTRGPALQSMAETGPGTEVQRDRLGSFMREHVLVGKVFRLSGLWCRNDLLARPDLTPPCHGQEVFSETGIIWRNRNIRGDELAMFPHVVSDSYFESGPPDEWLRMKLLEDPMTIG